MPIVVAEDLIAGRLIPLSLSVVDVGNGTVALRILSEGRTIYLGGAEVANVIRHLRAAQHHEMANRFAEFANELRARS